MKRLILWLALLLPFFANAQVNGTIQKTVSTGTIRGNFGSNGLDTLPRVTGVLVNGYILKYNASTNKWYASPDPTYPGLQDSLTKKANKDFSNVASGAIAKAKADTSATGLQTVSNFFPKGDTRYAKGVGDAVLTTGNQSIAGTKTFSNTITGTVASGTAIAATGTGTGIITVNATGSQGRISTSDNKLVLAGASGDASLRAVTGGLLEIPSTAGGTDAIVYSNVNGLIGRLGIGTGLSMSGGVLSATGGGTGAIGGSGTTGMIPVFSGSSAIANSVMEQSGSYILTNGSTQSRGTGSGTVGVGPAYGAFDAGASKGWINQLNATYGIDMWYNDGSGWSIKNTFDGSGNITIGGTVTGNSFTGAGTGLTGTASGLSIGGNAATATNSTQWGGQVYNGSSPATIQYALVYDNTNTQFRIANASQLNSFTGSLTGVSIATANGFTGSSSGGATPALTISTTTNAPIMASVTGQLVAATTTGSGSTAVLSNSPTFTGTPTLPTGTIAVTQSPGNNSTAIATTAYVDGSLTSKTNRMLKDWYADANNVTTTETDLYNYTVPSNTLVNNGDKLYFEIGGIYGGTSNSKDLRLYFGNSGYLFQSTTASGSNWTIKGFIVKVDATNYRIVATNSDDAPEKISTYSSTGTVTNYTGTNVFKITGTGTASADITAKAGYLEFKPAAP